MSSLRAELTLRLLLPGALLLALAGTALDFQVRRALFHSFDASLQAVAESLAGGVEQRAGRAIFEITPEAVPQFQSDGGAAFYLLAGEDGREFARSRSAGDAKLPLAAGPPGAPVFHNVTLADGRTMRCAAMRFVPREDDEDRHAGGDGPKLAVVLVAGRDFGPLTRTLSTFRGILVLVGAGTLAAFAALIRWGVRGGLAPVERLAASVAAVEAATLSSRFPVHPLPTELRPIATRVNELLARLEAAFARERRFTAMAAHELRTPLAELRSLAEVNLATPATEAERRESWHDVLAASLRMETLASRLLELARMEDAARLAAKREPVALHAALEAAFRPWRARAHERGLSLQGSAPTGLQVQADDALLGIILGNLCANAVEHAPAGSEIRVSAERRASDVILSIANRAGDLTAQDLPRLFERFWRKDAARSDSRHHGLGLALAAEAASLLGGILTANLTPAGELHISLALPAAE